MASLTPQQQDTATSMFVINFKKHEATEIDEEEKLFLETTEHRTINFLEPETYEVVKLVKKDVLVQESNESVSGILMCRICHGEESNQKNLIVPCNCSGTLRYVHHSCLLKWLKMSESGKNTF